MALEIGIKGYAKEESGFDIALRHGSSALNSMTTLTLTARTELSHGAEYDRSRKRGCVRGRGL